MQRIRIGMTGLALVFFLVLLGTAISRSSEPAGPSGAKVAGAGNAAEPEDSLAQIGVAPGQSSGNQAAGGQTANGAATRP